MRKVFLTASLVLGAGACAIGGGVTYLGSDPTVLPTLEELWAGRPVLEMEAHPVFASMEREEQRLSDGSSLFHHRRCLNVSSSSSEGRSVVDQVYGTTLGRSSDRSAGEALRDCCDRVFRVKDGIVLSYAQVSGIRTPCKRGDEFMPPETRKKNPF